MKSFGDFQETCFSIILAAEGLKKAKLALPRSMGIKQNNASHRARGSRFWFLQPLQRENVQIATHALHPQEQTYDYGKAKMAILH